MKILSKFFLIFHLILTGSLLAQEDKAELRKEIADPVVEEELEEPDGVSIKLRDDGWVIFARGTGIYDFNDAGEIQDATKIASLKAKANLAKFLKESIQTEDSLEELSDKRKKLVKGEKPSVTKEEITRLTTSIKNSANEILRGVITLKTTKIPDGDEGGTVQVNIVQSSKTVKAAGSIRDRIAAAGKGKGSPQKDKDGNPKKPNEKEVKKADTDF